MPDASSGDGVERIGHFRLDRVLGTGGFATVWLAYDENLDASVAIKVLAENWAHNDEIRRRFTEEARILWRMESPHIVRVYGVDTTPEGRPYFVMEYADAGNLEGQMKARHDAGDPYSIDEALGLSVAIADGLVEAQGRNIVHRDLKPSNVLFKHTDSGSERLLIADFGIARSLEAVGGTTISAGTPHYMAPEQTEGRADRGSDVYSAAVILFELLTGAVPFPYQSVGQVIRAQLTESTPDIATLRSDIPPSLAATISRGLAADPAVRHQSVEEWRTELLGASDRPAAGAVGMSQATLGPDDLVALRGAPVAAAGAAVGASAVAAGLGGGTPPPSAPVDGPPAPTPGPSGASARPQQKDRRRRRTVMALFAILALIAAVVGISIASTGKVSAEVFRVPATSVGSHPFTKPVGNPRVGGISLTRLFKLLKPPAKTLAIPKGAATNSLASFAGNTPGLYGGTEKLSVCDASSMVTYLEANPAKAAAWASVEGIATSQIPAYIATLTDAVLRVDTRVTNHGFQNGTANPIQEVLQAGTAVLIDQFGVPRARCFCGNPLTPPIATTNPQYSGPAWSGFSPATTEVIVPGPKVSTFVLVAIPSGGPFLRTPGPNDSGDTPAPPNALAGSPFAPGSSGTSGTPVGGRGTVLSCTTWSVNGTTLNIIEGSYYRPTLAVTSVSSAGAGTTNFSGSMTLPEGQWENAGDQSATNPVTGQVVGKTITFLVNAPKINPPGVSMGFYQGTIAASGQLKVGTPIEVQLSGTAFDKATVPPGPTVDWSATGRATCLHTVRVARSAGVPSTSTTAPPVSQTTVAPTTSIPTSGQSPAPPTTQPPTCQLSGSITVQGGNPSVLSPSGGTTTVVSDPVVISTGSLIDCGHHYRLAMTSSGGGSYTDCETGTMSDDVTAETNIGDTLTISLETPPNACG